MVEEIIQTIKRALMPDLSPAQMEKLENVLCITLHGKKITEERNELTSTGEDGDVAKINMFLGSKKDYRPGRRHSATVQPGNR